VEYYCKLEAGLSAKMASRHIDEGPFHIPLMSIRVGPFRYSHVIPFSSPLLPASIPAIEDVRRVPPYVVGCPLFTNL